MKLMRLKRMIKKSWERDVPESAELWERLFPELVIVRYNADDEFNYFSFSRIYVREKEQLSFIGTAYMI